MTTRMAADEAAADYIAAGAERAANAGCAEHGHSWAPNAHGRIGCVRCSLAPHTPITEETR